jgi:hypothetical protein
LRIAAAAGVRHFGRTEQSDVSKVADLEIWLSKGYVESRADRGPSGRIGE